MDAYSFAGEMPHERPRLAAGSLRLAEGLR